jgi:hypothetical protein
MKAFIVASIAASLFTSAAFAGEFELAGMKSKTPDGWKEEKPSSQMRLTQFKLAKAEGDPQDAEIAVFHFPAGASGGVEANLKRQLAKFKTPDGKTEPENKVDKIKVGKFDATYQDVKGTFLSKAGGPFDPNAKVTEKPDFEQLYVVFTTDSGDYYLTLLGPAKTVAKHKTEFEEFLKSFK